MVEGICQPSSSRTEEERNGGSVLVEAQLVGTWDEGTPVD